MNDSDKIGIGLRMLDSYGRVSSITFRHDEMIVTIEEELPTYVIASLETLCGWDQQYDLVWRFYV